MYKLAVKERLGDVLFYINSDDVLLVVALAAFKENVKIVVFFKIIVRMRIDDDGNIEIKRTGKTEVVNKFIMISNYAHYTANKIVSRR